MTDDYRNIGNLSQQERWRIWQESQKEQNFTISLERQGFFQGISKEWEFVPVQHQEHGQSQELSRSQDSCERS